MKIRLTDENKRKIVYDILNIFYDESAFVDDEADIRIESDKIIFADKTYDFENNYELKATLYNILVQAEGYESPWGMLTGSKPSKLLQKMSPDEMASRYFIADDKMDLLIKVKFEQEKLSFDKNAFNLYINIPFCPTRCRYCSYPTLIGLHHDRTAYIDLLIREINEIVLPEKLDTIYIGGGTPSDISHHDLERLLNAINNKFSYDEFTFEAGREDTLDTEKLEIIRDAGVDRISLNPQTFNEDIIKSVGRTQDLDHFLKMYDRAIDLDFIVNMDFIVGLVGESADQFAKNFKILEKLKPHNITFHALATKVGSKYKEENKKGSVKAANEIAAQVKEFTEKNSYKPYYLYRQKNIISNLENVGYHRDSTAQRYNIIINEELENVVGLGMNANTKLMNGKKYRNARNMKDYMDNIKKIIIDKNEILDKYKGDK